MKTWQGQFSHKPFRVEYWYNFFTNIPLYLCFLFLFFSAGIWDYSIYVSVIAFFGFVVMYFFAIHLLVEQEHKLFFKHFEVKNEQTYH